VTTSEAIASWTKSAGDAIGRIRGTAITVFVVCAAASLALVQLYDRATGEPATLFARLAFACGWGIAGGAFAAVVFEEIELARLRGLIRATGLAASSLREGFRGSPRALPGAVGELATAMVWTAAYAALRLAVEPLPEPERFWVAARFRVPACCHSCCGMNELRPMGVDHHESRGGAIRTTTTTTVQLNVCGACANVVPGPAPVGFFALVGLATILSLAFATSGQRFTSGEEVPAILTIVPLVLVVVAGIVAFVRAPSPTMSQWLGYRPCRLSKQRGGIVLAITNPEFAKRWSTANE
jgi:hypothetical protein